MYWTLKNDRFHFISRVVYAHIYIYCTQHVTGSWKTYLVSTSKFSGISYQKFSIFFCHQFLLHLWIKQLFSFLAGKFETQKSFLLGDMVVITQCRCAKEVGLPRSGHILDYLVCLHRSKVVHTYILK